MVFKLLEVKAREGLNRDFMVLTTPIGPYFERSSGPIVIKHPVIMKTEGSIAAQMSVLMKGAWKRLAAVSWTCAYSIP